MVGHVRQITLERFEMVSELVEELGLVAHGQDELVEVLNGLG